MIAAVAHSDCVVGRSVYGTFSYILTIRRSFPAAAPTVWNFLPAHLCSTLISRRQFRDGLKSHLFADAYF